MSIQERSRDGVVAERRKGLGRLVSHLYSLCAGEP
jgi:hypothetical protein